MYEIGLDEILGRNADVSGVSSYEDVGEEEIGASRALAPSRGLRGSAARYGAQPAPALPLRMVQPTKAREQFLGFQSTGTVAASGSQVITAQPQTYFRPERFVIPAAVGANFNILDLKVGNVSQLVTGQFGVPAAIFAEGAFGVRLKLDTVNPAIFLSLTVQNTDTMNAHAFSAAMIGPSVQ